jgi:hypothetical protein
MSLPSGAEFMQNMVRLSSLPLKPWLLAIWIAAPFVYFGVVMGATFWIDGFCYSGLAAAFRDPELFREFNSGWGKISLGHVQPGIAALCWILQFFPDHAQWPLLAILQRTVAFAALTWCSLVVCDYRPTLTVFALTGLLAWNPFYQSFHSALLTESLNSSLLLSAVAISFLIIRNGDTKTTGAMIVAAGCVVMVLITNIRSYYGLACLLMFVVASVSLQKSQKWTVTAVILIAFAFAAIAYPTLRWISLKDWYLPKNDMAYLLAAAWSSSAGGPHFEEALRALPDSAQAKARGFGSSGAAVDYNDARALADILLAEGENANGISVTFKLLSAALNADNDEINEVRLRKALISSGFIEVGNFHFGTAPLMHRSWKADRYAQHQRNTYLYHAWYWGGNDFDSFFLDKRDVFVATTEGQDWFRRTHTSYVKKGMSRFVIDPLRIALIPFDVWALLGVASMIYLSVLRWDPRGVILALPVIISFAVLFSVPLANPRYAYTLLPIYFVATMSAASKQGFRNSLKS